MENIHKIETELATKLEELGFKTKHGDGVKEVNQVRGILFPLFLFDR